MKRTISVSLVFFLLSLAVSAQRHRADRIRRNNVTIQPYRNTWRVSPEIYRMQAGRYRQDLIRRRIMNDGIISPFEKRRLKKIKQHRYRHHPVIKHRLRRLS